MLKKLISVKTLLSIVLTATIVTSSFSAALQTVFAAESGETAVTSDSGTTQYTETNENADDVTNYDGEQDSLDKINDSDYMTSEQYSAMGFSLDAEQDFDGLTDENGEVIDPLDGYETQTVNELYMGEGNRSNSWQQKGYLLQTAEDYPTSYSNVDSSDSYFFKAFSQMSNMDYNSNTEKKYQFQKTESIKLGNLNNLGFGDYVPDSIIQAGMYTSKGNGKNNGYEYTCVDIAIYSFNQDTYKFEKKQTLDYFCLDARHDFGQYIEIDEAGGYLSLAVGDYDGDGYEEFAMYAAYGTPRVYIFEQNADGTFYEGATLYLADMKNQYGDTCSYFNNTDGRNRPLCSLSTTDISGRDDLVISVSMPFVSDVKMTGDGLTAVYTWRGAANCEETPECVFSQSCSHGGVPLDMSGKEIYTDISSYRMKFSSATTMDLTGNGDKALVIAGNMEINFYAGHSKGDLTESNLIQLVYWDGSAYQKVWEKSRVVSGGCHSNNISYKSPVAVAAAAFSSESTKQTLFLEGVFLEFATGDGSSSTEKIQNGGFSPVYTWKFESGDDKGFFHTAISGSFVENGSLYEQMIVVFGDGSGDSIYLDMYMFWKTGSDIQCEYRNDYFDHRDEDDDGTFFTLCAVDVDNDSIYYQYEDYEVAYSNPNVYTVMLSSPYWSELDYGTAEAARGQTSFSVSYSTGESKTGSNGYTAGAAISQQFGPKIGPRAGFNISAAISGTWSHQKSLTKTDTLTFSSKGGCDKVALTVTPIATYKYKVYVPEHPADEEDIECYKSLYGTDCPYSVGDTVPAEISYMYSTVSMDPVYTTRAVSEYNKVVEEYNRLLEGEWEEYCETQKKSGYYVMTYDEYYEEYKMDIIDVDEIYPDRVVGDPSTYASKYQNILSTMGDTNVRESNKVSVGITGYADMTAAIGESTSETHSHTQSITAKLGICVGGVYPGGSTMINVEAGYQGSRTTATTNTDAVTYTMEFKNLPDSAVTDITSSGVKTSNYNFDATLVKWQPVDLDGVTVIGCTVSNVNTNEIPSLSSEFYVSGVTDTTAVLNWTNSTNSKRTPAYYEMYILGGSASVYTAVKDWNTGENLKIPADEVSYEVENLKENTTYKFRLKAYYNNGKSSVMGPPAEGKTLASNSGNYPNITAQPNDIYRDIDETAEFSLSAKKASGKSDNVLEYKWQKLVTQNYYSTAWTDMTEESGDWVNVTDDGTYDCTFNAAYYAKDGLINSANAKYLDETIYRCAVTESVYGTTGETYTSYSDAAVLYIGKDKCPHNTYENGFCTECGAYQPATLNSNGVYEIGNAGQFYWFASLVNGDSAHADFEEKDQTAKAVLTKDIDLENREWIPIMNFNGEFDGQNYTISNLKITKTTDYSGLFGACAGTIKDFSVKGEITLSSDGSHIGGVLGYADGAAVTNVRSYVNISNTDGELKHVGGVIGSIQNNETFVDKCVYYGTLDIKNSADCIGGVIAYTNGGGRINNCANYGSVTVSAQGANAGGILGYVNNSSPTVKNCYNYGTVSNGSSTSRCGAVIGWARYYGSDNIANNYYLEGSSALAFGSESKSGATGVSKTAEEFASGEVAYLLNSEVTDGTQAWYQNIDNGETPDAYPVFEGGTVYGGYKCEKSEKIYSNYPLSTEPTSHKFDDNGFCTACGAYQPAAINSDGVYEIGNAGQLYWFASLVNGDSAHADFEEKDQTAKAVLTKDIDLENREWIPIMNFNGEFDGQNYTISNLKITKTTNYSGLFGASAGTIKNFAVKGEITLSSGGSHIGGVLGYADGATISNVASYVNISNTDGELKHVGGVIGSIQNNETFVDKCVYYGTLDVKNSVDCIGGVIAYTNGGGRINNCANYGSVTVSAQGAYAGGILGYVNNSNPTVKNCYNYGTVSNGSSTGRCGAVIGWARYYGSDNIANNYYLEGSSALAFGSESKSGATGISKTAEEFASGEVAYLLNSEVTDGTQVWYQNIDNGKTLDDYPVFEGGTVYYISYKDTYSNTYSEKPADPDAFDKDDDGNLIIKTYDDLVKLSQLVRSDYETYGSQSYVLANNIKADDSAEWTQGIGSVADNKPFNGSFDGKGYCIIGLNVNASEYGGLFEIIGESGCVKNLFVFDCDYTTSPKTAGGIAAINNGTIDHCISGVNLTTGIIHLQNATIDAAQLNSIIKGDVSGGIVGENNGLITGCRNAAVVSGTQCGGIASINMGKIYGCANNAKIGTSNSSVSGGLVGKNGGTIESSYNSGTVNAESENAKGSIAGINGYGEVIPTVTNVFYTTANGLNAVGTDSTQITDDTNIGMTKSSDFQSSSFVDKLNAVSDESVVWIKNSYLNKGYPIIEGDFLKIIVKSAGNNITVKGKMHEDLNIKYEAYGENDNEYSLLSSSIGENKILKAYSVSMTDSIGNYIPAELWCQGEFEISVPVDNKNVQFAGIDTDGKITYYKPDSVENGIAVFTVSHPMSFAVVETETENVSSDNNTGGIKTTNDNTPIQTGAAMCLGTILLVAVLSIVFIFSMRRRNRVE